jgi:hypothetical protein
MKLSSLNEEQRKNLIFQLENIGAIGQNIVNGDFGDLEVVDIFLRFTNGSITDARKKSRYIETHKEEKIEFLDISDRRESYAECIRWILEAKEKLALASKSAIEAEDSHLFKEIYAIENNLMKISNRFIKTT